MFVMGWVEIENRLTGSKVAARREGFAVDAGLDRTRGVAGGADAQFAFRARGILVEQTRFAGAGDEGLFAVGVVFVARIHIGGGRWRFAPTPRRGIEIAVARHRDGFGAGRAFGFGFPSPRIAHART